MKDYKKQLNSISPVPFNSKFYGETESVNQKIDLYRKTIKHEEQTKSKWGVGALA